MPELKPPPAEWTVSFGCFSGYVLCDLKNEEGSGISFAKDGTTREEWLRFGVDLRTITEIRQASDKSTNASLYRKEGHLAQVNASVSDLMPHWIRARLSRNGKEFLPEPPTEPQA